MGGRWTWFWALWAPAVSFTLTAQVDEPKAGIFVENGRLVLTRSPAPDSPGNIRVWWNTEGPNRAAAAPLTTFSTSVEPDDSLHLITEISPLAFDKAFFFIETLGEFMGFTTDLGTTPNDFAEGPAAQLLVGIDLGAAGDDYRGTLDFSLIGHGSLYGRPLPITLTATFDGRLQSVAVLELDDREVTGPQIIILRLDQEALSDAAEYQKALTIQDDDYYWSGAVDVGLRTIPIRIQWTKADGETRLIYLSDGGSLIPEGRYDESRGRPIADLSTPLVVPSALGGFGPDDLDADLTLTLSDFEESETEIRGEAAVTFSYRGAGAAPSPSHLDHTTTGTFILRREPHPIRDREPVLAQ